MSQRSEAWKDEGTVRKYLDGIRGAIPQARDQIDVMLRLIDKAGGPVDSFVDIGCGSGALTLALLDRYPGARATLADYSEPMLTEARQRLAPYGDQCAILTSDLAAQDWLSDVEGRAPFDAAVSGFAIHHLTDERKRELYAEAFALLRPGAFSINIEHVRSPPPWLVEVFDDVEYVFRPDRADNILALVEDQCEWLRAIGFQDVDCYLKLLELAVFGGRKPA